jgi:hypothetical protein
LLPSGEELIVAVTPGGDFHSVLLEVSPRLGIRIRS